MSAVFRGVGNESGVPPTPERFAAAQRTDVEGQIRTLSPHRGAATRATNIRLMEEQFIHFPVRTEMELHPEALKLVDDEGSALVGTEFVGWLAPNRQRELAALLGATDQHVDGIVPEVDRRAVGRGLGTVFLRNLFFLFRWIGVACGTIERRHELAPLHLITLSGLQHSPETMEYRRASRLHAADWQIEDAHWSVFDGVRPRRSLFTRSRPFLRVGVGHQLDRCSLRGHMMVIDTWPKDWAASPDGVHVSDTSPKSNKSGEKAHVKTRVPASARASSSERTSQ
jgi:hypothetical protein